MKSKPLSKYFLFIIAVLLSSFIIYCSNQITSEITPDNTQKFSIDENSKIGTLIGTLDLNGDTIDKLIIKNGNIENPFLISSNGKINVVKEINYEAIQKYDFEIFVKDNLEEISSLLLEININDVDEIPPEVSDFNIDLSLDVPINNVISTIIANHSENDIDKESGFEYQIDLDYEGLFIVDQASGEITITKELYPNASTYILILEVMDNLKNVGYAIGKVNITNINNPLTIEDQIFTINEDANTIGTVIASDAVNIASYIIINGNDNGIFNIDNNGLLTVLTSVDYETTIEHILVIEVTDNLGNKASTIVTININDLDEVAPSIDSQTYTVDENVPHGTSVADIVATDNENVTAFNIIGNGVNKFSIDNMGRLITAGNIDFESGLETTGGGIEGTGLTYGYILQIEVSDAAGNKASAIVTINVNNLDEVVPSIDSQTYTVDENVLHGTSVADVIATDNEGSITSYTITSGNDGNVFSIDNTGKIITIGDINFEVKNSYQLSIEVSDAAGNKASAIITINVNNIDSVPVLPSLGSVTLIENVAVGYHLLNIVATDADNDIVDYSIISGNGMSKFTITTTVNKQGELKTSAEIDYETAPISEGQRKYSIEVEVRDANGNISSRIYNIRIVNQDENPVITNQTFAIDENVLNGAFISTVVATDDGGVTSYDIVGGSGQGKFSINNIGQLTTAGDIDFETGLVMTGGGIDGTDSTYGYILQIEISDAAGNKASAVITINVNDLDEVPPTLTHRTFSIDENVPIGTSLGSIIANDNEGVTSYNIIGGNGGESKFSIDNTGELVTTGDIDYEIGPAIFPNGSRVYSVLVEVSDAAGNTASQNYFIIINDILND